jgi:predicted nucleotidyltransferase
MDYNGAETRHMTPEIQRQIDQAVAILREAGARSVYVFGSVLPEESLPGRPPQDIDLAVEGLPPEVFLRTVGKLLGTLELPVDLIDLDRPTRFTQRLRETGSLHRVG